MREVVCFPIGCHSCFFDGAFVVALVGLTTVKDLWDLLGDLTVSMVTKKTLSLLHMYNAYIDNLGRVRVVVTGIIM